VNAVLSTPAPRRLLVWLRAVTICALCALLAAKALWLAAIFDRPMELTYCASANAYVARRVQQGKPLYDDWRKPPHVLALYGPVLYLPVAYMARVMGADNQGIYRIARWISLLATMGTAAIILWKVGGRSRVSRPFAVMAGLIFLTCDGILIRFDFSFRPDAAACFFTMLGLALVDRSDRPTSLYGSIPLFLLAFLYKQSTIVGPLAVVIYLLVSSRKPRAILYAIVSAAVFATCHGLLEFLTAGCYSLNTIVALKGHTTLANIPSLLSGFSAHAVVPLAGALYVLRLEVSDRKWQLFTVAFAVSVVVAAASTYRDGSDANYYIPSLALACVVCGRGLCRWWRQSTESPAAGSALTLLLMLATIRYAPEGALRLADLPTRWQWFSDRHVEHAKTRDSLRKVVHFLNSAPGPVLSYYGDVALYCPNSLIVDTLIFTGMADVGVFDDRKIINEIRQKRIAAVVLDRNAVEGTYQSTDSFSRRWKQAMSGRYQLHMETDWAVVYVPQVDSGAANAGGTSRAAGDRN
jgi:hypothetical protein